MIPKRHDQSRVGLLGGSFNPAHEGHREISLAALDILRLDAVWWLVSPANPLKDRKDYAPYEERLAAARRIADHPRIVVSNFEERKGLQYTADTLETLVALWPDMRFCWLMGADSLQGFHRWRNWLRIAELAPIAVFNRPDWENAATDSEAARTLVHFRLPDAEAGRLLDTDPPVWVFVPSTRNPISSTEIRRKMRR